MQQFKRWRQAAFNKGWIADCHSNFVTAVQNFQLKQYQNAAKKKTKKIVKNMSQLF